MRSTTKQFLLKYVTCLIVKRIQPPKLDKTFFFHPFFKLLGNYINNTGHQKEKNGACPYRLYDRHHFLVYALNAEGLLVLNIIDFLIPKDAFPAPGIDFPCYIISFFTNKATTRSSVIRGRTERAKAY